MNNTSRQYNLPPMALQEVASPQATPGNKVASERIVISEIVMSAATQMGLSSQDVGAVFGLSVPEVSKCFGPNNPDRNRLMKQELPLAFARQIALALCEATGLAVAGPDAERHALADLLTSCANYVRVHQR